MRLAFETDMLLLSDNNLIEVAENNILEITFNLKSMILDWKKGYVLRKMNEVIKLWSGIAKKAISKIF